MCVPIAFRSALDLNRMMGSNSALAPRREEKQGDDGGGSTPRIEDMMGCLNLMAEEDEALIVGDDVDDDLESAEWAMIDKCMSSSVLHIQTILSAMRPAWGNPRGLQIRSVEGNLFIAEFAT